MSEKTNKAGDTPTTCVDVIEECQKDLVNDLSLTQKKTCKVRHFLCQNELRWRFALLYNSIY